MLEQKENVWRRRKKTSASSCTNMSCLDSHSKARTTKQQARIDRFDDLKENLHQVKRNGEVAIDVATTRLGKQVLELKDASFKIENKTILSHFDLLIQSRERLGITGENGAGKSTLLNILAGRLPLEEGERTMGVTVKMAYYTQTIEAMNPDQRMIAYLQEAAEEVQKWMAPKSVSQKCWNSFISAIHAWHQDRQAVWRGKTTTILLKLLIDSQMFSC